MSASLTRADIVARHLTLDEGVRAEIEALRAAGQLGDGYRTEPRCHVCCEVESKELVNKLIAAGLTNREIAEACEYINGRRQAAGDDRLIVARNVWTHKREHFNIDKPAMAVYREIYERRAEEAQRDHINGTANAIMPYTVWETTMVKGYHHLTEEETTVGVAEMLRAATLLHEFTNRDASSRKMADVLYQMERIITAAEEFVPEELREAFIARVEGRDIKPLQVLTDRVHETAQQAIREFTPTITMDEQDELSVATSPLPQLDPTSIDVAGVSVASTTPNGTNPRAGSVYDPTVLAAAAPVWLHPAHDGSYLMVSARRWVNATPVGGSPGVYSAITKDLDPSWVLLDGLTGRRGQIPGATAHVGFKTTTDSAPTLVAGASRAPGYLYLLHAATINSVAQAILQHWMVSPVNSAVTLAAEEVLPTVTVAGPHTVVFNKGVQYQTPYLHLYGTDPSGNVYRMRKSWASVGNNGAHRFTGLGTTTTAGLDPTWQYFTGTGFSANPAEIAPMPTVSTFGPMSFAAYRTGVLMTTVAKSGTVYSGKGWFSTAGRPFTAVGSPIALGDSSAGTYLGGGVQLQPGLGANPIASAMTAAVQAGVPYVIWTKSTPGGNSKLTTAWDIWPVTL